MKSFLIVFILAFAFASAQVDDVAETEKQIKAEEQCDVLYPGPNESREQVLMAVLSAERLNLRNSSKWCHLNCVLQKIGFLDENSNMRTPGVFRYNMKNLPELAPYANIFLVALFQISRSTQDMEDKCMKAYVSYYRFSEIIFVLSLADNLQNDLDVNGAIKKAIEEGKPIPMDLKEKTKEYLRKINTLLKFAIGGLKTEATSSVPTPRGESVPNVPAAPAAPVAPTPPTL